jgi:hypothetical protein
LCLNWTRTTRPVFVVQFVADLLPVGQCDAGVTPVAR